MHVSWGDPTGSATNEFEQLLAIHERDPDGTRWDPQGGLSEHLRLGRKNTRGCTLGDNSHVVHLEKWAVGIHSLVKNVKNIQCFAFGENSSQPDQTGTSFS